MTLRVLRHHDLAVRSLLLELFDPRTPLSLGRWRGETTEGKKSKECKFIFFLLLRSPLLFALDACDRGEETLRVLPLIDAVVQVVVASPLRRLGG